MFNWNAQILAPSIPPPMSHPLPPKPIVQAIPPSASSYRGLKRERPHSPDSRDHHHRRSRTPPRRRARPHVKCPTVQSTTTKLLQGEGDPYLQSISFSSDGQYFVSTCTFFLFLGVDWINYADTYLTLIRTSSFIGWLSFSNETN